MIKPKIYQQNKQAPKYLCFEAEKLSEQDIETILPNDKGFWMKETASGDVQIEEINGRYYAVMYTHIPMGFDIETTKKGNHSYMYIWQWSIGNIIITGRTWDEFDRVARVIQHHYKLGFASTPTTTTRRKIGNKWQEINVYNNNRCIVWDANFSFEFQFLKHRIDIVKIFAKAKRNILTMLTRWGLEFRDCLAISGADLLDLSMNYTQTKKAVKKDPKTGRTITCDLDYSKMRNSKTPLTKKEWGYVWSDVAILSEWAEYVWDNYIMPLNFIPLTKTNILNNEVKTAYENRSGADTGIDVRTMFPRTHKIYQTMRGHWYAGGTTTVNPNYVDEIKINVGSRDITSSYPTQMCTKMFPMSQPNIDDYNTQIVMDMNALQPGETSIDVAGLKRRLNSMPNCKMYFVTLVFKNLKCTGYGPCLSAARCLNYRDSMIGQPSIAANNKNITLNGKIWKGECVVIGLCECEINEFFELYEFEDVRIYEICRFAKVGKLPRYLLDLVEGYYIKKAQLKKQGLDGTLEYVLAKQKVNSFYGLLVKKIIEREIMFRDINGRTELYTEEINYDKLDTNVRQGQAKGMKYNADWERIRKHATLAPQWGIVVCAYAREQLYHAINHLGSDFLYCDTDSVYYLNPDKHNWFFDQWNNQLIQNNKAMGFPPEMHDLGTWDDQCGKYRNNVFTRFKMLGAKRYIYEFEKRDDNGIWHLDQKQTIAGLGKHDLYDYCHERGIDMFEYFADGFELSMENVRKLTSVYNEWGTCDEITDEKGNVEYMTEESSLTLVNCTFSCFAEKRLMEYAHMAIEQRTGKAEPMARS